MTFLLLFVGTILKHCSGEEGIFIIDFVYILTDFKNATPG